MFKRKYIPKLIRTTFAVLVFMYGLIELVLAFHVRAYGRIPGGFIVRGEPVWLAEHGIVAGVALLYLARFIYRGERRAAIILGFVVATLLIKYALLTPNIILFFFSVLLSLGLWFGWPAFDRNTGVPTIVSKLKSLAVVLGGVMLAIGLLFGIASITNRSSELSQDSLQIFGTSAKKIAHASNYSASHVEYRIRHIRYVGTGLIVSLVAIVMWSLFRPSTHKKTAMISDQTITRLLQKYAVTSDDYFKIWPRDKAYFVTPDIEGFIAYKQVSGTVFALADPICSAADRPQLMAEFSTFARQHGWSICYIPVTEQSVEMYKQAGLSPFRIGANAVVPIQDFNEVTVRDKWWRWQLNRAAKANMHYEVSRPPHNPTLLADARQLSDAWLGRAGHVEQGFALGFFDETYLQACQLHVLRGDAGELVAFANELPIFNDLPQTTVDLIRFKPDVSGAMPVLIANIIMGHAVAGVYKTFDLGFVPLAKIDTKAAAIAKYFGSGRFSADGLVQFKGKFKPVWYPQYVAYEGDIIDLTALFARLERAMKAEPDNRNDNN